MPEDDSFASLFSQLDVPVEPSPAFVKGVITAIHAEARRTRNQAVLRQLASESLPGSNSSQIFSILLEIGGKSPAPTEQALWKTRPGLRSLLESYPPSGEEFKNLTEMEQIVMELHLQGKSHREIAVLLEVRTKTISNIVLCIRTKLSSKRTG